MSIKVKELFDTKPDKSDDTEVAGYTKLFSLILASTIWREDDKTRIVWITLLALANKNGIAETSIPGLADFARVTIKDCEAALEKLRSPDSYSRTKEHDGRRIQDVDGGFFLINHGKYRAMMSAEERREYNRIKQQEHRSKVSNNVNDSQTHLDESALSAHTEAEAESESEAKKKRVPSKLDFADFQKTWNESGFPKILTVNGSRYSALRARFRDVFFKDNWQTAISKAKSSNFCNGKNDRGWVANVDWFLKPNTVSKLMEGAFDNRSEGSRAKKERKIEWTN